MLILNKERAGLEKKFYELCTQVVGQEGYELYDLDYVNGSQTLRVFIKNKQTNTADLQDCVKIDKALSPFIDEANWMPESLVLEVSSPGIYRQLRTQKHFEESVNELISVNIIGSLEVNLNKDVPAKLMKQKKFRGKLISVDDSNIELRIEDKNLKISFKQIKKANLDPDLGDLS